MASKDELMKMFMNKDFVDRYKIAEKATGPYAWDLVDHTDVAQPVLKPHVILDSACGTGVVSDVLHRTLDSQGKKNLDLTCGDISDSLVEYMNQKISNERWPNTTAKLVDAQNTQLPSDHYTHVFAGFAFVGFPDPKVAMTEVFRILQPGGTIAISSWARPDWVPITKAAVDTMPGNLFFPTTEQFLNALNEGWDTESHVRSQIEQGGFDFVQVTTVSRKISVSIAEFMVLITAILPVITKTFWTQAQRDEHEKNVPPAIQQYLEEKHGADGLVPLEPMVFIATGQKPQ
ncbi:hypothetical protein FE257_010009 [Aspergillus nanangensis]|uniref:Methyltransferase domain-containing protein n=1 Tax=Aspergillus nanangensis TaxID=2582783 RepID=A0AAD4CW72_ASPNN|nr:hypothetical protein FE257_010009 [Aspergillus nanangensis]